MTNKLLSVKITTSLDSGFSKLETQLNKLISKFDKFNKIALTSFNAQSTANNRATRSVQANTRAVDGNLKSKSALQTVEKRVLDTQRQISRQLDLEIRQQKQLAASYKATGNSEAYLTAKKAQYIAQSKKDQESNWGSDARFRNKNFIRNNTAQLLSADVSKEIKSSGNSGLLSFISGNTKDINAIRKRIQNNIIKPILDTEKAVASEIKKAVAFGPRAPTATQIASMLRSREKQNSFGGKNLSALSMQEKIAFASMYHDSKASHVVPMNQKAGWRDYNSFVGPNYTKTPARASNFQQITKYAMLNPALYMQDYRNLLAHQRRVGGVTGTIGTMYKGLAKAGEVAFRSLYSVITLGLPLALIAQASDKFTQLQTSIGRASKTTSEFHTGMNSVRRISRETYSDINDVAGIYESISRNARKYNLTQQQTINLTRTIATLNATSGSTSSGVALTQLKQSLDSNKFGGDELRSVFENSPMLARAIAAGMQKTTFQRADIGLLRDQAKDPKRGVTGRQLIDALGTAEVQQQMERLQRTIRHTFMGALTNLGESFMHLSGVLNERGRLAEKINNFANRLDDAAFFDANEAASAKRELLGSNLTAAQISTKSAEYDTRLKQANDIRGVLEGIRNIAGLILVEMTLKGAGRIGKGAFGNAASVAFGSNSAFMRARIEAGVMGSAARAPTVINRASVLFNGLVTAITNLFPSLSRIIGPIIRWGTKLNWITLIIGAVIVSLGSLWKSFLKTERGAKFAGQEMNILSGSMLLLGDYISGTVNKISNAINSVSSKFNEFNTEWSARMGVGQGTGTYTQQYYASLSPEGKERYDRRVARSQRQRDFNSRSANSAGQATANYSNSALERQRQSWANNPGPVLQLAARGDRAAIEFFNGMNPTILSAIVRDTPEGQALTAQRVSDNARLAGDGFPNGTEGGEAANIADDSKGKKGERANKFRDAIRSAMESIADIRNSILDLNNSSIFGTLFSDAASKNRDFIKQLEDSFRELGGVPATVRNAALNALNDEKTATINKRLEELVVDNMFSLRDVRNQTSGLSSQSASYDSGVASIIRSALSNFDMNTTQRNAIESALGGNTTTEQLISAFNENSRASLANISDSNQRASIERILTAVNRQIVAETQKLSNALFETNKALKDGNADTRRSNIFDYNQQANGVFGREADLQRRLFDVDSEFRQSISRFKGSANSDITDGNTVTVTGAGNQSTSSIIARTARSLGGDELIKFNESVGLYQEKQKEIMDQQSRMDRLMASPWVGAKKAVVDYLDSTKDVSSQVQTVFSKLFDGLQTMITNFVMDGKLNFRDFAKSILNEVVSMMVRIKIVTPIVGAISGWIDKIFGKTRPGAESTAQSNLQNMVLTANNVYINGSPIGGVGAATLPNNPVDTVLGGTQTNQSTSFIGNILNMLKTFITKIFSVITNIFSAGSTGSGGGILSAIFSIFKPGGTVAAGVHHSGGLAGSPRISRLIDSSMYGNIGRDEIPALLNRNELVLTKQDQASIRGQLGRASSNMSVSNFSPSINITYNGSNGGSELDAKQMAATINTSIETKFREMLIKERRQGGMLR